MSINCGPVPVSNFCSTGLSHFCNVHKMSACPSFAMPYNFFVQQAWPTSAMHVNIGLSQFFQACTSSSMHIKHQPVSVLPGLIHFCNVYKCWPVPVLQCFSFFCSTGLTHFCNIYKHQPDPLFQCSIIFVFNWPDPLLQCSTIFLSNRPDPLLQCI